MLRLSLSCEGDADKLIAAEPESPFKPKRPTKSKRVVESDDEEEVKLASSQPNGKFHRLPVTTDAISEDVKPPPAKKAKIEGKAKSGKEPAKLASIFAKPVKTQASSSQASPVMKEDNAESSKSGSSRGVAPANGAGRAKGKAPAQADDEEDSEHAEASGNDEEEGEEELDDEEEEEQEGEAAVKLYEDCDLRNPTDL